MSWIALLVVYVTWFACLRVHSNVLTWLVPGYSRSQIFRLPKDLISLGEVERSRARKSNPVRSLWIGAAPSPCCHRQLLFRCPYLCKEPSMVVMHWFEPLCLMNPVTVVPMFLVRVEARTPEWFLGWCVGDTRLCTVVFRRGVTITWYQSSQADCRLPLAGVVVCCSMESPDGFQPSLPVRHGYYWSKDNVIGFPSHLCSDSHGIRLRCETIALAMTVSL